MEFELLRAAAKAVGYPYSESSESVWINECEHFFVITRKPRPIWNPLNDDGDALRLAVDLSLAIDPCDECTEITVRGRHHEVLSEIEWAVGKDRMPYVRRAIVEAAARINCN